MVFPHLINQTTRQSDLCFSQKVNKEFRGRIHTACSCEHCFSSICAWL